ncbi:MAG TPA: hypothetical protein VK846_17865 [Candidatus Limnocylindria bacterium]|nr:hypothetical protein [Candidatus Limnocylindria bacterium]
MEQFYVSGEGHYGDQNGDAGQAKWVINTRDANRGPSDVLQEQLIGRGILVEIVDCIHDRKTGAKTIHVFGQSQHFEAARAFFLSQTPPVQVEHVDEVQKRKLQQEQARNAAAQAAAATALAAGESTICTRGHGPLRLWDGKLRCWTCGWPFK